MLDDEAVVCAGSRWVQTTTAPGYTRRSTSRCSRCAGVLSTQRPRGRCHWSTCRSRRCSSYAGVMS
ncbi:Uncharacterised protein [Mycobacteroides abscessus subsp. abscessus]|nr:Uncharacterised protein [Mycobacteroides abscessus subsp. abscessus]